MAAKDIKDKSGQRYGRLVACTRLVEAGKTFYLCSCDCGKQVKVASSCLVENGTASCGCSRKARTRYSRTTHGMSGSVEYRIWSSMIDRCTNEKNQAFHRYGGRGIKVCDRWKSFVNFYADMGPRPPGMTLDRHPNNDGDYEPTNCRWATREQQNNNKGINVLLTWQGRTLTLSQWARESNLNVQTLYARIAAGWATARALTTPPKPTGRRSATFNPSTT